MDIWPSSVCHVLLSAEQQQTNDPSFLIKLLVRLIPTKFMSNPHCLTNDFKVDDGMLLVCHQVREIWPWRLEMFYCFKVEGERRWDRGMRLLLSQVMNYWKCEKEVESFVLRVCFFFAYQLSWKTKNILSSPLFCRKPSIPIFVVMSPKSA